MKAQFKTAIWGKNMNNISIKVNLCVFFSVVTVNSRYQAINGLLNELSAIHASRNSIVTAKYI